MGTTFPSLLKASNELAEVIRELANHIELVKESDKAYFRIKGSKGKEKSFTSYYMVDWWEQYFPVIDKTK